MKHTSIALTIAVSGLLIVACHSGTPHQKGKHHLLTMTTDTFSRFIPVDTANIMLSSYLQSINYSVNDTDIQSLIIDVNQLRKYIDSIPDAGEITNIKLMFAHTFQYATSPRAATNAGYKSGAFTVVIAAYDADGNYVLYPGNMVLDYTQPCPPICPPGTAASALLPVATAPPTTH